MAREEDAQAQSISVPSEDPVKKDKKEEIKDDKFGKPQENGDAKDAKANKNEVELSEEDLQLKTELEMLVERLRVSMEASKSRYGLKLIQFPPFTMAGI